MEINEEWNNFMHRVTEISQIISGLTSSNKETANKAQSLADEFLSEEKVYVDENIKLKTKSDRTIINKKACHKIEKPTNSNEMNPETFMKEVSRDAEERAADRKIRKERADTFKTRATKAFRRRDYETALQCYSKAIEQIKDSCLLYTNRALTHIRLRKYYKVFEDCEWALKINENTFKAHLYRVRAHKGLENESEFNRTYEELLEKYPQHKDIVDDFLKSDEECESEEN